MEEQPAIAAAGKDGGVGADGDNKSDVEQAKDAAWASEVQDALLEKMKERVVPLLVAQASSLHLPVGVQLPVEALVSAAVDAFAEMDLLTATRALMQGAKGSFGLLIRSACASSPFPPPPLPPLPHADSNSYS